MALHHNPRIVTEGLQLLIDPADPSCNTGDTILQDLSGNGRHGEMLNGLTVQEGAMRFTDSGDAVNFGTDFRIAREKTLSIWIKSDRPLSTQDNWEVGFLNQGSTSGTMFGFMYGVGNCQDLGFWGYGAPYDMSVESTTNKWSSDGQWHNAVVSMNYDLEVRVWIDGVQRQWLKHSDYGTLTDAVQMASETTNYFLINSRAGWNSGLTYIDLGPVTVYNRALSDLEILENYEALKTRFV